MTENATNQIKSDSTTSGSPFEASVKPSTSGGGWICLLALTVVGLAGAGICIPFAASPPTTTTGIPVVAVTIWLCNVSGFWIAFGKQPYRFLACVVPFMTAAFLNWLSNGQEMFILSAFFYGIATVVAVTGFALRMTFGELRQDWSAEAKDALQFNLWQMFILITTVGVLTGLGRIFYDPNWLRTISDVGLIVAVMVAAISLMTVVAIWALLGREVSIARALALASAMVVGAIAIGIVSNDRLFWICVVLAAQAMAVGAILCLRAERFRFVRS